MCLLPALHVAPAQDLPVNRRRVRLRELVGCCHRAKKRTENCKHSMYLSNMAINSAWRLRSRNWPPCAWFNKTERAQSCCSGGTRFARENRRASTAGGSHRLRFRRHGLPHTTRGNRFRCDLGRRLDQTFS